MVVATWPPGRALVPRNSILEPRVGYSETGITVSVALRPTPMTSTSCMRLIYPKQTPARADGRQDGAAVYPKRVPRIAKPDTAATLEIDGHQVRISNPDKLYFSEQVQLTKLDLVQYFPGGCAGGAERDCGPADCAEALCERGACGAFLSEARTG